MQLTDITRGRVTLELDPGDCLALAQACRAQIRNDASPNFEHAAALCVAFEALGMAAFALDDPGASSERSQLWAIWGPREGREIGALYHTDLDGQRAEEPAPACAEKGAA